MSRAITSEDAASSGPLRGSSGRGKCAGGTACFLYPTPNAGTSQASQAFWEVKDVEAEVAELKARGVKFEEYDLPGVTMKDGIATGGGAKTAWFKDTEGNILAISQRL